MNPIQFCHLILKVIEDLKDKIDHPKLTNENI